jgi:hypothetical protein
MRVLPSVPAAIVVGAVGGPLFLVGVELIEERFGSGLLVMVWAVIAFIVPVSLAVVDVRELIRSWRRCGLFSQRALADSLSERTFRTFYVPAWTRMAVWFVSVVLATLLLKAAGVAI